MDRMNEPEINPGFLVMAESIDFLIIKENIFKIDFHPENHQNKITNEMAILISKWANLYKK